MKVKVIKARPSPLNYLQWLLTLECGHELWVTRKRNPRATMAVCPYCKISAKRVAP